ncbi:MAG: hypothetical protein ACREA0_33405, partial [bacterium]
GTIASAFHSDKRYELVYAKGPYVVHMLRTWMGWEKFTQLTAALQDRYKGRSITTDTIAREASTIMGYDMFPFFDQWIRDQGIPKLRYSWSAKDSGDGKFLVSLRFRQEDIENFKILMVPITFDLGVGEPIVLLKPILKPDIEILVKVPVRPKNVTIDDQRTQLANIRVRLRAAI